MRGRPTCPTEQKKNSVGATGGSPLFLLLQGKVGYQIAPSSDPASPAHLPPKGKALGVGRILPVYETHPSQPAQPGGGPLRTLDYGPQARQKRRRTPAGSPQPEKVGPGRKNLFLPGALSSGFLRRKPGPRPGPGGPPGRCAPRPASEPPTRRVRSATRPPHRRPPLTPPAAGRRPGHAPPVGSPAPPGRAPRPQWCWGARPG